MKKTIQKLATILCLFFAVSFSTQAQFMDKGDVLGSGGFYFPSGGTLIKASVDFGVGPNISVGGNFINIISGGDGESYIGGRVTYHLGEAFSVRDDRTLDPYVGGQIGKFLVEGADIGFSLPLGLRYMFNDKVGAYAEYFINLNQSKSGIPNMFGIGISFRFNN
jgi:outer membrane immunogenic protein